MLGVSIFTGIYYWIMKTDVGYGFTHAMRQPLFSALFIGLIMGDFTRAIVIGAAIQILYIGLVAAGSNLPADDCLAGLIAIPIAIASHLSPAVAVTIAVPVGVLGVFLDQFRKTINIVFVQIDLLMKVNLNKWSCQRSCIRRCCHSFIAFRFLLLPICMGQKLLLHLWMLSLNGLRMGLALWVAYYQPWDLH